MVVVFFRGCVSEANHSSIVFPVTGNIYPAWAYYTTIKIGKPPTPFKLFVDSGSYITWVKCHGHCENCDRPPRRLYRPPKDSTVQCQDPLCAAILRNKPNCIIPTGPCEYRNGYGDESSTQGYLVKDVFQLQLMNGSVIDFPMVFGCGYKEIGHFSGDGIIGLSRNQASLVSQIHSQGLIQEVTGHCFSKRGGGFLFLGDDLVPHSGISWTPIIENDNKEYRSGPVDLLFDGSRTQVRQLQFTFDSGSISTYLNKQAYRNTLDMINRALKVKPLTSANPERWLPICWRRRNQKPISSLNDIRHYFKPLSLRFTNEQNVKLDLPVQAYLILVKGKVCLGIQNGDFLGPENENLIGAISMQDKLVIYDNVNRRIGWASRAVKELHLSLFPSQNQRVEDRPDIVLRIFHIKLSEFVSDIKMDSYFDKVFEISLQETTYFIRCYNVCYYCPDEPSCHLDNLDIFESEEVLSSVRTNSRSCMDTNVWASHGCRPDN
ncbi:aspartyl protease APCB1-like [Tripterygium wilfordii]|uniref:aspartyl protease APCB1-like n=1 Tax=Tripterygium wilfordii TaxID=458696 RepID=UPI0018F84F2D|nr:aspartyl protease APCB1-like [Tripterygium wilfordii]